MRTPIKGDYVLATKWRDGAPHDGWAVGFYDHALEYKSETRYLVQDGEGRQFRGNGFRRVKNISAERGAWLLAHKSEIEQGARSLWWWVRQPMIDGDRTCKSSPTM